MGTRLLASRDLGQVEEADAKVSLAAVRLQQPQELTLGGFQRPVRHVVDDADGETPVQPFTSRTAAPVARRLRYRPCHRGWLPEARAEALAHIAHSAANLPICWDKAAARA